MPPWVHDDLLVSPLNVRWTDTAKEELKEVFNLNLIHLFLILSLGFVLFSKKNFSFLFFPS